MTHFFSEIALEEKIRQIPLDKVGVIVLAGGEGKRLDPLTKNRCKPALTFGGRYALVDVPISHALASGLKKIFVIGQYMVNTLQTHISQAYFKDGLQQQVNLLVPEEREGKMIWYKGTADAIRQNLPYLSALNVDYFLILSGDQLYNINFQEMLDFAAQTEAEMVIAAQPVAEKEAKRMGLLKMDPHGTRLIDFCEKPQEKSLLEQYITDDDTLQERGFDPIKGRNYLGSMGIYFFQKKALFSLLQEDSGEDFGKHLIRKQMEKQSTHVYLYDGYWEDIGTVEAYYHANLALTRIDDDRKTGFQCYDETHTLFSKSYFLPAAKIHHTKVDSSIICEGAIIEAQEVTHSILGVRTVVKKGSVIRDSIFLGNESYGRATEMNGKESFGVGEDCFITRAIIDENVTIGNRVQLINKEQHHYFDSVDGIMVREGIIVVPRGTKLPDDFIF